MSCYESMTLSQMELDEWIFRIMCFFSFKSYPEDVLDFIEFIDVSLSLQVIAIRDIIRPPVKENFNDVYIVYDLMDTDLHQIIKSEQHLADDHCRVEHQPTSSHL